jgi:hypothetical protein
MSPEIQKRALDLLDYDLEGFEFSFPRANEEEQEDILVGKLFRKLNRSTETISISIAREEGNESCWIETKKNCSGRDTILESLVVACELL